MHLGLSFKLVNVQLPLVIILPYVGQHHRTYIVPLSFLTLQGKYPLVEDIKEVFSVLKLTKIVKKTSATTSVCGNKCFYVGSNETSTHLKNMGGRRF